MRARWASAVGALRGQLDSTLFPAPARGERRFGRGEAALIVLALLALAIVLQMFRVGPHVSVDSLWAEDGVIFLQGGLEDGFAATFHTYAGYLVFVPRLIGELAALVPLRDAPAAISVVSGLLVGLSGIAVWFGSAGLIRNPYLRGLLVALTVLSPVANLESVASGAYVPWYMLFGTFWLLFWRPASVAGALAGAAFILATGLSTPGVWFFLPVALLRLVSARDRREHLLLGAYFLGGLIQLPVIATNNEPNVEPAWSSDIWSAYLQRVIGGGTFGERLAGHGWEHLGWTLMIGLLVFLAAALAVGLWRAGRTERWFAALAIPISLVMFIVSAYQRGVGPLLIWQHGTYTGGGGRYVIVPALLLVSIALLIADRAQRRSTVVLGLGWGGLAVTALMLVGLATSFDVENTEGRGNPTWGSSVDLAELACATGKKEAVAVPIAPPGFAMLVPCDEVSSAAAATQGTR